MYSVRNRCSEIYESPSGDRVPNAEIRVFRAEPLKESGSGLSCLSSYRKGKLVQKTKSNAKGRFSLKELSAGDYFVVIKGQRDQVVSMIQVSNGEFEFDCSKPESYGVSESGFVGNMCDVLQAKDFF
jgi:hypothetical protein